MFCGASWQIFWPATDPARYQCYALTFWFGSNVIQHLPAAQCSFLKITTAYQAFSHLPAEYPPLTLLPFSLPVILPVLYYQFAFALVMSLTALFVYWLLQHFGPQGAAQRCALYLFIGALGLAQLRYDLLPALLTLLCIIAADRKHWTAAYCALAFGVLLKIYPLLLLPALFLAEQQAYGRIVQRIELPQRQQLYHIFKNAVQWRWSNLLLFLSVLASVTGIFALLDFNGAVTSQLNFFAVRPLQIESTGSTLLWIAHHLGIPWQDITYSYGSINIISPLGWGISFVGSLCLLAGISVVLWLQWQRRLNLAQAAIALLLVLLATSKVLSPQYLLWLIPLMAYAGSIEVFGLLCWGAICLLTNIVYIFFNSHLPDPTTQQFITMPAGFFELIGIRNTLLVLLTLAYLFNWFHIRQHCPSRATSNTKPQQERQTSLAH